MTRLKGGKLRALIFLNAETESPVTIRCSHNDGDPNPRMIMITRSTVWVRWAGLWWYLTRDKKGGLTKTRTAFHKNTNRMDPRYPAVAPKDIYNSTPGSSPVWASSEADLAF